jgi:hypothetical protein
MGISPVRLLDMAAGNLTNAVADLVKHVGMGSSTSANGVDHRAYSTEPPSSVSTQDHWHQDPIGSSNLIKQQTTNGNNRTNNSMTPSQLVVSYTVAMQKRKTTKYLTFLFIY